MINDIVKSVFDGLADLEKNMGTKAIIAVTFVAVCGATVALSKPVPEWFVEVTKVIVFTYFGASIQKSKE